MRAAFVFRATPLPVLALLPLAVLLSRAAPAQPAEPFRSLRPPPGAAQDRYGPPGPYGAGPAYGAQWAGEQTPQGGQQSYGGCYGCSYMGDYAGNAPIRRPAPPLRLQGQWRNGWWYY